MAAPPRLQVFHSTRASADLAGGDSLFVDGLRVAHDMRRDHPRACAARTHKRARRP
jgi:hypothetical protein